jgi:DNA-binding transcriptional LysR family regulator
MQGMKLYPSLLTQLRAFEVVARHMSFKLAAQELNVTQAALSHHVRHLEEVLGTALIRRMHRRIELTSAGIRLEEDCARAFHILSSSLGGLKKEGEDHGLTVSVAPYFSARLLTPRLGSFWARHPDIDLTLHHAYQAADFSNEKSDAGISWGNGRWKNVDARPLIAGLLTPVCSASYRAKMKRTLKPTELLAHKLFYEFSEAHWRGWFALSGVSVPDHLNATRIDDSHALRQTAIDGHGVALFFSGLIEEDLRTGQLVRLFDVEFDSGDGYFLTWPSGTLPKPKLRAFTQWLLDEAASRPFA